MIVGDYVYLFGDSVDRKGKEHLFKDLASLHWAAGVIVRVFSSESYGVVLPNDPMFTVFVSDQCQLIPSPEPSSWVAWKSRPPSANSFVFTRDFESLSVFELAWSVGDPVEYVVLPNDPYSNRVLNDQWSLIPVPE